jgi:glycine/D-amino acid oxidase-like deaminating enzyme
VLGCYDSRITFYSQQARALELVYALYDQQNLTPNARIAVVGGGAGGVTLAAALVLTDPNLTVVLFERADDLLPLQRGSTRRRIDPHIYDWPRDDAEHEAAELPLLDWRADAANQVRQAVGRAPRSLSYEADQSRMGLFRRRRLHE